MKTTVPTPLHSPASIQRTPATREAQRNASPPAQTAPDVDQQISNAATLGHRFEQAQVYSPVASDSSSSGSSSPGGNAVLQRQVEGVGGGGGQHSVTGLPQSLKIGIETLSGQPMDDVRVYYDSVKPTAFNALAFAQGSDIHLAPGQERHLPHEAWHLVQQRQGRVKPTMQMKGASVNDDVALEQEADRMGARAMLGRSVDLNRDVLAVDHHASGCACPACAASAEAPGVTTERPGETQAVHRPNVIQLYCLECKKAKGHAPGCSKYKPPQAKGKKAKTAEDQFQRIAGHGRKPHGKKALARPKWKQQKMDQKSFEEIEKRLPKRDDDDEPDGGAAGAVGN